VLLSLSLGPLLCAAADAPIAARLAEDGWSEAQRGGGGETSRRIFRTSPPTTIYSRLERSAAQQMTEKTATRRGFTWGGRRDRRAEENESLGSTPPLTSPDALGQAKTELRNIGGW